MKSAFGPVGRYRADRLLPCCALGVLLAASLSLRAATYTVLSGNDDPGAPALYTLRWAIEQANANPGSTINIGNNVGTITFNGQSPIITAPVTINGNWNTISGNGTERIFFIDMSNASDAVRINNVTLADGYAKGGDGGLGAGGGGLGAGGALFVNRGQVTVSNVSFTGNTAEGGRGGGLLFGSGNVTSSGGGGGGLGGNGGTGRIFGVGGESGGGGGYGGNGGDAGGGAGGGGGLVGNGGTGMSLSIGHKGGGGGGGALADGGNAYRKDFWAAPAGDGVMGGTGGAGGGGQGGNSQYVTAGVHGGLYGGGGGAALGPTYEYDPGKSPRHGGNGGGYGGGGGAVSPSNGGESVAGDGGDFGGGGGNSSGANAGDGGFGGGGGGSSYDPGGSGTSGSGGFGGGGGGAYFSTKRGTRGILGGEGGSRQSGGLGGGGGGGAAGGAIFVRSENGASLIFQSGDVGGGNVIAGAAGGGDESSIYRSTAGKAAGTGIFINGGTLNFDTATGVNIYDTIYDAAFDGGLAGTLVKNGVAQLYLGGNNHYAGGTVLNAGFLTVAHANALGSTGTIAMNGGVLAYSGITTDFSSRFSTAPGQQYRISTYGSSVTFATALSSTGGVLEKISTGALILSADNTYSGGTTISSGTLQIGAGGTTGSVAGNITNNDTLVFNRSNQILFSGAISGSGKLVKDGAGALDLGGNNSYSGGTVLNSGILTLAADNVLGTGTITINGGNIRAGGAARTLANNLILSGNFTLGRLTFFTGAVTLTNTVTITSGNPDTGGPETSGYSGVISGNHGLTFTEGANPTGLTVLSGNNTYTGLTTVNSGTVRVTGDTASSGFRIGSGGVLELNQASGNREYDTAMTISGAGTLRKTGAGQTIWAASAATFAMDSGSLIDVREGTFVAGSWANENWTANKSDLHVAAGAAFYGAEASVRVDALSGSGHVISGLNHSFYQNFAFGVDNGSGVFAGSFRDTDSVAGHIAHYVKAGAGTQILTGSSSLAGTFSLEGGVLQIGDGGTTGALSAHIANNAALVFNRSNNLTHAHAISGTGSLTKNGAGVLTLDAQNTYTGGTLINSGTLVADHHGFNGTFAAGSTVTVNTGATLVTTYTDALGWGAGGARLVVNGGTVTTDANTGQHTTLQDVTMTGGRLTSPATDGYFLLNGPLVTKSASTTAVIDSPALELLPGWTPGSLTSFTIEKGTTANGIDLDISSSITGSGPLIKSGNGVLRITGTNTFSGGTTINAGRLQLGNSGNVLADSRSVTINGGTLALGAANETIGTLSALAGSVVELSNTAGRTLTINQSADGVVAGRIQGSGGSLIKNNAARLVLSGSNSYTGGTTIRGGTLAAAHNHALGTNTVTVEDGVLHVGHGVFIANPVVLAGGSYERDLGPGSNLAAALNASSSFAGGKPDTAARILQGTYSSFGTLESSFRNSSSAMNDHIRLSDVYSLDGTGDDIFVLQLSFTGLAANTYLAWLDTDTLSSTYNRWVNAVDGNEGGTSTFFARAYNPGTDFHLGYYGVDVTSGSVWAVLNHNSDFAIVPEPSIGALLGLGFFALGVFHRQRRGRLTRF